MSNILINKSITASNSFAPYLPSKAIDGSYTPDSRWLTTEVYLHPYLVIDLGGCYWVNQWDAFFMGSIGWDSSYNVTGIELLGSTDNVVWRSLYYTNSNTGGQLNVSLIPSLVRYLKVIIWGGSTVNKAVASIVELEAYELPYAPFLSSLVPSTGTLSPAFSSRDLNYSISVAGSVNSIAFTPTALFNGPTIKVNGLTVNSGSQSQAIQLASGSNTVKIDVTYSNVTTTYTVVVNKENVTASYLSGLSVMDNYGNDVELDPMFSATVLDYSIYVDSSVESVSVTPSVKNSSSVIKVNGVIVTSNTPSDLIPVPTPISIEVDGSTTYTIGYM
jgi:hypothetical protein